MSIRRTMLFLPANNPNMIMNGGLLGADALIFDLEDAVAPDDKDAARDLLCSAFETLDFGKCERIVRFNGLDTDYWMKDLKAILPFKPDAVMPPKVSGGFCIQNLDAKLTELEKFNGIEKGSTKIIALVETALGVEKAYEIATSSPRMVGIFLGAEDLTADLHSRRTKGGEEIRYARSRVVCAARAAGIEAYDTPFTDVNDLDGLETDAAYAKQLGFSGKACINPAHIAVINRIFSPDKAEIAYAREVFNSIEEGKRQGKGVISLHGKMIDKPIVQRARQILKAASEIEGVDYFA